MRKITAVHRSANARRGLSIAEFVGCLLALSGGTLIGLLYLGVDLQKAGQQVVGKCEALLTDTDTPVDPAPAGGDPASAVGVPDQDRSASSPAARTVSPEATLAYWQALTECLRSELQGRYHKTASGEIRGPQDNLSLRSQGHLAVIESLSQLDGTGVDARLLEHGEQIAVWHQAAAELFEQAGDLLASSSQIHGQNPLAEDWRTASVQLQKEEQLLVARQRAMATYLNHEYPGFAPFTPAWGR